MTHAKEGRSKRRGGGKERKRREREHERGRDVE
jgi:hypothetical protein